MKNLLFLLFLTSFSFAFAEENLIELDLIPFEPDSLVVVNLGPNVNSSGLDYGCNITFDYKSLGFVSDRPGSMVSRSGHQSHDLWKSDISFNDDKYIFSKAVNLEKTNSEYNEGAFCFTRSSIFITYCNLPQGIGNCDIYQSSVLNTSSKLINLGPPVNTKYFESFPSVSYNEDLLFLTRHMTKSSDDMEIFLSIKDSSGKWTEPVPLPFNTKGNEISPCILYDNVTLIFASDGLKPNYGGKDLYITRFDKKSGKWAKPQNLGKKINSKWDEMTPSMNRNGNILFFASDRQDIPGYQGNLDIYLTELPLPLIIQE